jgi:hypothetical protein
MASLCEKCGRRYLVASGRANDAWRPVVQNRWRDLARTTLMRRRSGLGSDISSMASMQHLAPRRPSHQGERPESGVSQVPGGSVGSRRVHLRNNRPASGAGGKPTAVRGYNLALTAGGRRSEVACGSPGEPSLSNRSPCFTLMFNVTYARTLFDPVTHPWAWKVAE